jgi:hypothetical protein
MYGFHVLADAPDFKTRSEHYAFFVHQKMNDLLWSAAGRDLSDATYRSGSPITHPLVLLMNKDRASSAVKPLWHLVPLPLNQINPSSISKPRGPPPSLQSLCLKTISRDLHRLSAASLRGAPSHILQRILSRIRADRNYEDFLDGSVTYNPDESTIWALSTLLDPSNAEEDHSLALVTDVTLAHIKPNPLFQYPDHPLVQLPKLYNALHADAPLQLLTTLTIEGESVKDDAIQRLRYATHLTVLWMKGCGVTDNGIRLLGSSLLLEGDEEENRGMWRLRAWYLPGCRGVGDRSMKVFARFPGLVTLGESSLLFTGDQADEGQM